MADHTAIRRMTVSVTERLGHLFILGVRMMYGPRPDACNYL